MLDDVSIGYIMTHPPIEDRATRPTKKLFVFLRNQHGASSILILLHVTIQTVERIYYLCILILFYSMVSRRAKARNPKSPFKETVARTILLDLFAHFMKIPNHKQEQTQLTNFELVPNGVEVKLIVLV